MISTIYWFFSSSSKLYKRFHNIVQTFQIRDYQTKIRELNFSKKKIIIHIELYRYFPKAHLPFSYLFKHLFNQQTQQRKQPIPLFRSFRVTHVAETVLKP